jgi:eukaryotic-like serine/threonine-protein kinase
VSSSRPKPILRSSSGSAAEASFLRERLQVFGRIGGGLSVVFYVVVVLLGGASWWTSPQGVGILIVAAAFGSLSWIGSSRSAVRLRTHETAVILVATVGCGVHGWLGEGATEIRFDAVLALGQILVVRAVLIPSTWRRTAILGSIAALPVVLPSLTADRLTLGLFVGWGVVAVAVSTLISRVVHDLRERASEARRLGRYVLEAKIGEGGMGEVYRARHAMLRRPTAIKLLRADRAGEAAIARFETEVQRTAELTHPNTVSVYDYGRTADGVFYYAMELLPGLDLSQLVRGWGPMPTARAAHVLVQVCGSLHEAHEAGLVHRDVKAANVVLTRRGGRSDVAKVLDFGLVRGVDDDGGVDVDHVVGTPAYLSPEGLSAPETVDARTDLYAVGVLAYLLLSGRLPFDGETLPALIHQHLLEAPPPLPAGVPEDVAALVMSCLEKDREHRPTSAASIASALAPHAAAWTDELAAAWWSDVPPPSSGQAFDGSSTVELSPRRGG